MEGVCVWMRDSYMIFIGFLRLSISWKNYIYFFFSNVWLRIVTVLQSLCAITLSILSNLYKGNAKFFILSCFI